MNVKEIALRIACIPIFLNLLSCYVQKKSVHTTTKVNAIDPNQRYHALESRANMLVSSNRIRTAKLYYSLAIKLKPKQPRAWFQLGNCYMLTKKWEKAIDMYKRSIQLSTPIRKKNPEPCIIYANLGWSQYKVKKYNIAKK